MRIGVRLVAGFWRSAVVYNAPSSPDARRRPHDTDVEDSLVRNLQKCVAPDIYQVALLSRPCRRSCALIDWRIVPYLVTVFRESDRRPNVTEREALCVNSSALDLAEVTQKRTNRNKSAALTDFEYK